MSHLARTAVMYCRGLGLRVIDSFEDHDGFDGVILGAAGADYHFEFTHCRSRPVRPSPTAEDLVVFYVPTASEWKAACSSMAAAGFEQIAASNPYWQASGRTYRDHDGYCIVLQRADWSNWK